MIPEQRLTQVFVELADTLVADFDVLDLLSTLAERSVELVDAEASGVILSDRQGSLHLVASTSDRAELLELFELQNHEGPALDCYATARAVVNTGAVEARSRWPRFSVASIEAGFGSTHALPLRLRESVVGAMNLFCLGTQELSETDVMVGQALADIATIGLLQERAIRESGLLAEQLQGALTSRVTIEQAKGVLSAGAGVDVEQAFRLMRDYGRRNNLGLRIVAAEVVGRRLDATDLHRA